MFLLKCINLILNLFWVWIFKLCGSSLHHHLEVSNPEECAKMEEEFAEEIRKRGPDFKYFQDQVRKTRDVLTLRHLPNTN